jgi:hypothetical protein
MNMQHRNGFNMFITLGFVQGLKSSSSRNQNPQHASNKNQQMREKNS